MFGALLIEAWLGTHVTGFGETQGNGGMARSQKGTQQLAGLWLDFEEFAAAGEKVENKGKTNGRRKVVQRNGTTTFELTASTCWKPSR